MSGSSLNLWRSNFFFVCLGLLLHYGEAQVHTDIQAGPLYRVVGSFLSISCNVSGFISESAQKEFEFRTKNPSKPNYMNVISSADKDFGYNVYKERIRRNEITLRHVLPNSVLFEIHSLQKNDEGEYECTVINPESRYVGTYNGETTVKVIDNSLSVSSPTSTSPSYNEGDALTLTCQASSNTVQHTHLSVAWYLRKADEDDARAIISLNRDFTLSPGQGFEERYRDGLVRLDKIGEATYRLSMEELRLSDQGRIYCQAQEWIQDPDLTWYSIAKKDDGQTVLNVRGRESVPDAESLVVRLSAQQTTLQEGQELFISCNVDTHNLEEKFLSVAWLRGGVELARVGPTGILSVGLEYSGRENEGELRATRIGERDYRLTLRPVRMEDQGEYICRAWPQKRSQDGAFTQGAAQDSSPQLISILATGSGLSVEMQTEVSVNEGGRLSLACKVHGVKGQLSITWQRRATSTSMFTNVIGLSQEGVTEHAKEFTDRKVKATRPATDTFTLELDEVTLRDAGVYQCAVSEWKHSSKANSQSQSATVTVAPMDSLVKVNLIGRNTNVTLGGNVELLCRIRGPRHAITLAWTFQRDASTIDTILTLYSDGAISWSGDPYRYQVKVDARQNEIFHYLLINDVSHREAGSYQCIVSAFQENAYKKLPSSNNVAVMVHNPESRLTLTSIPSLTRPINSDIEINCTVTSPPSASSSRYAVTWTLHRQGLSTTIVSSDRDSLVTFGPKVEVSHRQRLSTIRTAGPSFLLTVRQAQMSDSGSYKCEVVEWLQDPRGEWFHLSPASTSSMLTLIEPANDLSLAQKEQQVIAREGEEVKFKCDIVSDASSPSFFYKVTWLYSGHKSSWMNATLVVLDHTGLLRYPENQGLRGLQGRIRFFRPTKSNFYISIQRVHEEDSGTYQCQVDQYQLDHGGHWQQKASAGARPVRLSVNVTESNLSIAKTDVELNVSRSEAFTVPCIINQQSSPESQFQVTWFWQKKMETKRYPIFTVYRNSTLQDSLGKDGQWRFDHPLQNKFNLTVLQPAPENSGVYFCEVEEWLPSLSHQWRRAAVENSGFLDVSVFTEGDAKAVSETGCQSAVWTGALIGVVLLSLLVIFLLVLKICRYKKSSEKKEEPSLWVDKPLVTKINAED